MGSGSVRRLARGLVPALAAVLCSAGVAHADEPIAVGEVDGVEVAVTDPVEPPAPEEPPVSEPPPAVGVVDGVPVAVAEAPVPGAATVAVQAERVAVGEVDGVGVGVTDPPVPTVVVTVAPATVAPVAPPAVERAAAEPTVALVLAAWG